jgi:hypothetical protein
MYVFMDRLLDRTERLDGFHSCPVFNNLSIHRSVPDECEHISDRNRILSEWSSKHRIGIFSKPTLTNLMEFYYFVKHTAAYVILSVQLLYAH